MATSALPIGSRRARSRRAERTRAEDLGRALAPLIIAIESSGNPRLLTKSSGALGLGQFVEETWLELLARHRPRLSRLPRAERLALRTDPRLSRDMVERMIVENARALKAGRIEPTPPALYLAHFLGLPAALRVLRAEPASPVETLVDERAVRNNSAVLADKTAGEVIAWAERCVGVARLRNAFSTQSG
jgi:hypothetical protein